MELLNVLLQEQSQKQAQEGAEMKRTMKWLYPHAVDGVDEKGKPCKVFLMEEKPQVFIDKVVDEETGEEKMVERISDAPRQRVAVYS